MATETVVTTVDELAMRIAEDIAPDEVELAPGFVNAYAEGGAARDGLYKSTRSSGAFDAGSLPVLFPTLLTALDWTSVALLALLGSGSLTSTLDCIKNGLALAELGTKGHRKLRDVAVPATDANKPLRSVLDGICTEFEKQGLPPEQVEILAFRAMHVMIERPASTRALVQRLASKK